MQTAVRKSSRRRVHDARTRPHVVLEARRDAAGARLSSYVLDHGLGHAHIDGVANQEGLPRRQAPYIGLDDHPRTGLDLGLQALRRSSDERSTADGSYVRTLPEYSSMLESELYG